jgi:hypothetical protein
MYKPGASIVQKFPLIKTIADEGIARICFGTGEKDLGI